jgi:hypothetical protein
MPADSLRSAAASSTARLLIHADDTDAGSDGAPRRVEPWWRRWIAHRRRELARACTQLSIADLQGRAYFAADDARSLIDLPLPAGTYHITARVGSATRRYTVTLQQGRTFDLHLHAPG